MPIMTIDTTPLSREQKDKIITMFTKTMCEITGLPASAMIVVINESGPDNFGVGGTQLSQMKH